VEFLAYVTVKLKPSVNDPQGLAVTNGLRQLGFEGVKSVRVGKHIEITIEAEDESAAKTALELMCNKLLANPVIEDYDFRLQVIIA
jgi:phosphoribosylformylglycinamidine synthase PurS subunit